METIVSKSNAKIKLVYSLRTKRGREKSQLFQIEGLRFVSDAYKSVGALAFEFVVYSLDEISRENSHEIEKLVALMEGEGVKCYSVARRLLEDAAGTECPQGIVAVVKKDSLKIEGCRFQKKPDFENMERVLILDKISDPGNLGTIIRTADSAGFDCVILMKGTTDFLSPKVLRSTMGSIFNIVIMDGAEVCDIEALKKTGTEMLCATLCGAVDYKTVKPGRRYAVIIGGEALGVCDEMADIADVKVKIPIYGRAESLNAAVAAGILMYEYGK